MLDRLIELSNADDFARHGYVITKSVLINPTNIVRPSLTMSFLLVYDVPESVRYSCTVQADNVRYMSHVHEAYMGYKQLNVYPDHPLLWPYGPCHEFMIRGTVENWPALLGDLYLTHTQVCGNWVDFRQTVYGLSFPRTLPIETGISLPEPLVEPYLAVFDKHKLTYTPDEIIYPDESYEALIIGNPVICPDSYNLSQPCVVAESLTAYVETLT